MSNEVSELRRFESFRLSSDTKELWYENDLVPLPEKAIEVLIALTDRPGEVVIKDDLGSKIWGNSPAAEKNLYHAIHSLRKAFREKGHSELIKTISRRGYRFVGTVVGAEKPRSVGSGLSAEHMITEARSEVLDHATYETGPMSELRPAGPPPQNARQRFVILGVVIAFALLGGLGFWRYVSERKSDGFAGITSLAVLPLRAAGEEDESLRMRVTDSVITRLGEIGSIRIRPTASVQKYLDAEIEAVEAGRELRVDAVFEGNVRLNEDILSIELRAISTRTGDEIWADRFVGEPDRLLVLQDTISERILELFQTATDEHANLALRKNPTDDPEAYESYLKGRYFWQKRTFDGLKSAINYFQEAIERDGNFAAAYTGLADSYYLMYDYDYDRSKENVDKALEYVDRAIAIAPESEHAYVTLGLIQTTYEWDWEAAASSFERAIELRPNLADAYHRRGMLRAKKGEFTGAEADLRRAGELDPTSIGINMNLGVVLYLSGKNEDAIRHFREAIERDGRLSAPRWYLARSIWQTGDKNRAMSAYVAALETSGAEELANEIRERLRTQSIDEALAYWISEWEKIDVSEHSRAVLSSHLNDKTTTLSYLRRAMDARHPWAASINVEPEFKFLKSEPEFKMLVDRLGLSPQPSG